MAKKQKKETKQMAQDDFIPLDGAGNIKEPGLIDTEGIQPLIVKSAEKKLHANGKYFIQVIVEVQGQEDTVQAIFNNLWLPMKDDEKKSKDFKMLMIKRFCVAFDIPMDEGVNPGDFAGAQADLPVIKTFYKNKSGQEVPKNEIQIPNLVDEGWDAYVEEVFDRVMHRHLRSLQSDIVM